DRAARQQGRAALGSRRNGATRRWRRGAGHHDLVAVDRRAGQCEWPRGEFCRLPPVQPCPEDEAGGAVIPAGGRLETRRRTRELCEALGKTPIEVPDMSGFVVNRLLLPYLFSAVELMAETGMAPADIDNCMTLGAGVPMGPIALLDYVG